VRIDRDSPPAPPTQGADSRLSLRPDNKGRVSSLETQAFLMQQYGLFEVRARMPKVPASGRPIWMSPRLEYEKLKSEGGTRESENEAIQIDLFEQPGQCAVHFGPGPARRTKVEPPALRVILA